ncbi:MAG: hypothetical protein IJ058_14390 [Lachnospiraceae bacterium]|nr:hypothetical protein [Lachnospiraceae bacterium]MBQ8947970.1 hypothetical protein [Lachnospiraceae bacterium]
MNAIDILNNMDELAQMIDDLKPDTSDLINTILESDDEILREKATEILDIGEKMMDVRHVSDEEEEFYNSVTEHSLDHQRYKHILLLSEKLKMPEEDAAKLLDTDPKELTYLKFNYQMMEMIHGTADEVARKYIEKVTGKQNA